MVPFQTVRRSKHHSYGVDMGRNHALRPRHRLLPSPQRRRHHKLVSRTKTSRPKPRTHYVTCFSFAVSLQDVRMHPNPETLHTIHGWIKKLGLDQVSLTAYPPNLLIFPLHPQDNRQPQEKIAKQLQTRYMYPHTYVERTITEQIGDALSLYVPSH